MSDIYDFAFVPNYVQERLRSILGKSVDLHTFLNNAWENRKVNLNSVNDSFDYFDFACDGKVYYAILEPNKGNGKQPNYLSCITSVFPNDENTINQERKKHSLSVMEDYCRNYIIFIDTCSLLANSAEIFWENIVPILNECHKKILLPLRCYEEVKKHSEGKKDSERELKAQLCLKRIAQLYKEGNIEIRGEQTDNFADNVFYAVFAKHRVKHKLLLITQDCDLSDDILKLNNCKSVRGKEIKVTKINKWGFLSEHYSVDKRKDDEESREVISEEETFRECSTVTTILDQEIEVNSFPAENSYVFTTKGPIRLGKNLGNGGEGTVYSTNTHYVAKIYSKKKITNRKQEKIQLMLSKRIYYEGICYPVEILFNDNRQFIGYLMPLAKGEKLRESVFRPRRASSYGEVGSSFYPRLCLNHFQSWKKIDTVKLCITILEKIKYLHDRNIIIGDINPDNILIVSPNEVYFVDTDSYQIEDFPCPVGTINFTAPEIQGRHFPDFIRTKGNEYFAIATLLFMIMLPGKSPYSQQGGEDQITNIKKMDFSYPLGDCSNKKTPDGRWRYIWSHLPYDIKFAFYNTFTKGGKYSLEHNRLSVDDWLKKFRYFWELLDSGKYAEQDEMSIEIFPTRFKKNSKVKYIKCKLCREEKEEDSCINGICQDCLHEGEYYYCKGCGKRLIFSNYEKYIKCKKKHTFCQDCYDDGRRVYDIRECVECGSQFKITNSQYDFYVDNGLDLPKRCESCRKQ